MTKGEAPYKNRTSVGVPGEGRVSLRKDWFVDGGGVDTKKKGRESRWSVILTKYQTDGGHLVVGVLSSLKTDKASHDKGTTRLVKDRVSAISHS